MGLLFEKPGVYDWRVKLMGPFDKGDEEIAYTGGRSNAIDGFEGFLRTAYSDGRECEQFTVMVENSDEMVAQIKFFKNGDISTWNLAPCYIEVNRKKKLANVLMRAICELSATGLTIRPVSD